MSVANGINPSFTGNVTAQGYRTTIGTVMKRQILTYGATAVQLFAKTNAVSDTNGFRGTLISVKVLSINNNGGKIDICSLNGTAMQIVKGSAGTTVGSFVGSYAGVNDPRPFLGTVINANGSFVAYFTPNPSIGDGLIEVEFTVANPED